MKTMYKKSASVLLALVMVLSLLPMAAFAAEGDAVRIGSTGYKTLQAAINNAKPGEVIEVLLDITSNEVITVDEAITIKSASSEPRKITAPVVVTADATLENLNIEWGDANGVNKALQIAGEKPVVRVKDCTITNTVNKFALHLASTGAAHVILDNTKIIADYNQAWSQAITILSPGCTLDITNHSYVSAKYYYAIVNFSKDSTINIKDSEVSAWGAIYLKFNDSTNYPGSNTTVNIESSKISGISPHAYGASNAFSTIIFERVQNCTVNVDENSFVTADGINNRQGIASFQYEYNTSDPSPANNALHLRGTAQILNADTTNAFFTYNGNGVTEASNQVVIYNTTQLLKPDGSAAVTENDSDGNFVNAYAVPEAKTESKEYKTLEAAVAAAARGDTVTLLKDVALSDSLQIEADDALTLDLNGHTLSNAETNTIVSAGNLTITDSKTTGGVTSSKTAVRVTGGSTTIQAGAYTGKYGVVATGAGIANISGGTLTGSAVAVQAQIGGTANISGGELTSANIAAVCLNQPGYAKTTVHITGGSIKGTGDSGFGVVAQGTTATETREKAEAVVTIGGTANITGDVGVFMKGYGAEVNVEGGSITSGIYAISGNGTVKDGDDQGDTVLNITGGTIKQVGSDGGSAIYHPQDGVLNISGDPVIEGENGIQLCSGEGVIGSITGGSITATGADRRDGKTGDGLIPDGAALSIVNRNYPGGTPKMDVSGGRFVSQRSQAVLAYTWSNNTASNWPEASQYLTVTGGYYTSDVRDFVTDPALASIAGSYIFDGTTYAYQVTAKLPDKVEIVESQPVVNMDNLPEEQQEALKETVSKITGTGLTAKAHELTVNQQVDLPADTEKLDVYNANLPEGAPSATEADAVTLVVAPRLDIKVESFSDVESEKSLKLDIKAVYDIKATTAASNAEMKEWDGEGDVTAVNTVTVEKNAGTLDTVGTEIEISIPLPAGFVTDETTPVYIHHIKNGQTYVYKAIVTKSGDVGSEVYTATFTNPHGFSTFIVKTEAAASIEAAGQTTYYATLQDAVDAVANGQTITVLKNGETATVGRTVRFTVQTDAGVTGYTITPGVNCTNQSEVEGEYDIVYHAPVIGGGESGDKPCDGGKDCPAGKFTDVDTGLWYHEAIDYVLTHGMMQGTSDTAFAPNATLTRAMLAQVLYNLEGKPAAGAAVFTDIPASAWYADAVNWAAAQKIVEGYGDRTFGPEAPVTRQQMAAILYRYAAYKAYDVSARGDLSAFTDGGQTAAWAEAAVEWAVGAKLLAGKGNGTLDPTGTATRAQVAQLLMNFCEQIAK